jgi:hypothetical protein
MPPLFGRQEITFYDVEESSDWRQAADDRRKLAQPIEMKPIPRDEDRHSPCPRLPDAPARNETPFIKRDPEKHAAEVAERARQRAAREQTRSRKAGRKRRPRPR